MRTEQARLRVLRCVAGVKMQVRNDLFGAGGVLRPGDSQLRVRVWTGQYYTLLAVACEVIYVVFESLALRARHQSWTMPTQSLHVNEPFAASASSHIYKNRSKEVGRGEVRANAYRETLYLIKRLWHVVFGKALSTTWRQEGLRMQSPRLMVLMEVLLEPSSPAW